jgi:hypothetical protein
MQQQPKIILVVSLLSVMVANPVRADDLGTEVQQILSLNPTSRFSAGVGNISQASVMGLLKSG